MAVKNSTLMANAWLAGSNDFQQRVPNPTQAGIARTVEFLFDPMNRQFYNQFVDTLINRIAMTYIRQSDFENPLAFAKKGMVEYGATVQEAALHWVEAHAYDENAGAELLRIDPAKAEVCYHTQNRQDKYKISVSMAALKAAFDSEYGLNNFIASALSRPRASDQYDEYRIMMELLGFYAENFGFYTVQQPIPTDEATAKSLLMQLRAFAGYLEFPSTRYTPANPYVPVTVKANELVLITTPDVNAALDVQALATLFNVDYAKVRYRVVLVDEFPVAGMYALLTTDAFFACWDTLYQTDVFWNPETLVNNHYLHHWGIYSVSPFVPAIAFSSTASATTMPTITETVTGFTLTAEKTTIEPGDVVQLEPRIHGTLTTAPEGSSAGDVTVAPDAATFTVTAETADGAAVALNSRTYVDSHFRLHIQKRGMATGTVITVTGESTYTDPSGVTATPASASVELTVR